MKIGDTEFHSRLFLGTSGYPSLLHLQEAIRISGTEMITVSLRREAGVTQGFSEFLESLEGVKILPNTAGCYSAREAVLTAEMAREIFSTRFIKLEVTGDSGCLFPDFQGLLEATRELILQDFLVLPYTNDDPVLGARLLEAGCEVLMPLAAPIGSAQGPVNLERLRYFRKRFPEAVLIVDAGLGRPSHVATVMEEGFDGVLVNTAVAKAGDPVSMARAFALATESGYLAAQSDIVAPVAMADASSPLEGLPFRRGCE